MELFGFTIGKKKEDENEKRKSSFVPAENDDGSTVIAAGGYFGQYVDIEGNKAKDDVDLIRKYREISLYPECDSAITDIVNEAINADEDDSPVEIVLDNIDEYSDKVKKLIREEFDNVINLLSINSSGHDIFRKWYVDGRLYFHAIIDESNPKKGILELRPIDATKIRKVRKVIEERDPKTGIKIVKGHEEYYIYQDQAQSKMNTGLKISKDSIIYVPSGLVDSSTKKVLSYLYKAIKPVNQLRMMEDSLVIYRMARAPERRVFYVDVGNLPKGKAEAYVRDIMAKYKNKVVYDAETGDLRDARKHMSMLEDFWLPRREGKSSTEITTLPGAENLSQIDDIVYFQKKLYRALNVPMSRLEDNQSFTLGRSSEITRDEVKFTKFIQRLRRKFADVILLSLKTQLILKGIISKEDWDSIKEKIVVDFLKDNHFAELKDAEILRERVNTLNLINDYVGQYYSKKWVKKNVLKLSEEEIEDMEKEMEEEMPTNGNQEEPNVDAQPVNPNDVGN